MLCAFRGPDRPDSNGRNKAEVEKSSKEGKEKHYLRENKQDHSHTQTMLYFRGMITLT